MATQSMGSVTPPIGHRIAELAKAQGITSLARLAGQAGIPERSLYRKVNEKPGTITIGDLADIAGALGITFPELLARLADEAA